jgi:CYTH domain-containing protein
MPKEIERKYRIDSKAKWTVIQHATSSARIRQGYITTFDPEVRIRSSEDYSVPHKVTIKKGKGLVREEVEFPVSAETADHLWSMVGDIYLLKDCYKCPEGWEVDVFQGDRFGGLILAEKELDSVSEYVELPEWLAPYLLDEVTEDEMFKNKNLAKLQSWKS